MTMDIDEVLVENPASVGREEREEEEEVDEDVIFGDDQGKKDGGDGEFNEPSPRGVLEITNTCDSDNGTGEKQMSMLSHVDSLREQLFDPNSVQWKSLFSSIKRKSARSISIIPLFGGVEMIARKSRKKLLPTKSEDCGDFLVPKPSWRNFSFQELTEATDNFSPDKLLGKGGHAEVYMGCIADGQTVAVKRITKKDKNDEDRVGDFLAELGIVAHINHPNAAKLIGFSAESGLHLVLQYLPNGSLATVLHGSQERLEWKARFKVAIGVAEGLQYLHSDCQRRIIHRDITASNILLADDFEPQISDFGLAKWLPEKWVNHVVSPIEGTFGYMAPEYFMHGIIDEKTDVFAFGVLLLELITGRRAVDSSRQSLVMWAKPLLEKDDIKAIADPRLGDEYDVDEMKRAMSAAATCIHHIPSNRPSMIKVSRKLKGEKEEIPRAGSAVFPESVCMDDYNTSTTYLRDLDRHMQLVME
ncbi:receptor-like cytosolic serine/threonine-protein kinase RBK1 [Ipomoea triloba]|uniref:receptor-like cytosolic serine/threonine-protein kinase RBK1 n=1 Tax=Ipomoea triloba TaxID=35885 RepID=UPI00125D02A1|nr:receptor-like cytosolic serine/threonine-protein kinase RBK1 [Ipomoea triloba]